MLIILWVCVSCSQMGSPILSEVQTNTCFPDCSEIIDLHTRLLSTLEVANSRSSIWKRLSKVCEALDAVLAELPKVCRD